MKAVTMSKYGGPEVLEVTELPLPEPKKGQLRVKVKAASINPIDGKIRQGQMKMITGSRFPKQVGGDFAGVVDAVGEGVTRFKAGDEVFGMCPGFGGGAYAEYALSTDSALGLKPPEISFEQAASLPVVTLAARVGVRDVGKVQKGTRILINGCTGGVGLIALQIAKHLGAHVTGTCSKAGLSIARENGADEIFDYREVDVTKRPERYDVIYDLAGTLPFPKARALLTPGGLFVDPTPAPGTLIQSFLFNPFRAQKHKFVLASPSVELMDWMREGLAKGQLKPVINRVFKLSEVQEATRYAERGGVIGKVILSV